MWFNNDNGCIVLLKFNEYLMNMEIITYIDSGGQTPRSFDFISFDNVHDINQIKLVIGNQNSNNMIIKTIYLSQNNNKR